MKIKILLIVLLGAFFSVGNPLRGFCQEEKAAVETNPAQETSVSDTEDISWVWGEVKSIDPASASLTVIYMDYQTDEEKELVLNTDQETKYEGVNDLNGIKVSDTASIDYVVKDGKNIAHNISIEKLGEMPEAPAAPEEPLKEAPQEQKAQ